MNTYQLTCVYIDMTGKEQVYTILFDANCSIDAMNKVASRITKQKPYIVKQINITLKNF